MTVSKDHSIAFAWIGMIAVVAFLIAWIGASTADPSWKFAVNNLSDFGVSKTNASLFFNYGCMITGALLAAFGFGRARYQKGMGNLVGGIFFILGGLGLIGVGLYPSDTGDLHTCSAVTAGLFIFLGIVAVTVVNWAADKKLFAGIGIVAAFLLVAMFIAYNIAKLEAYGIIVVMIWVLAECANMILSSKKS